MKTADLYDDLLAEGQALHALLADQSADFYDRATSFKNWTVHDVLAHLHFSDHLALMAATKPDVFKTELATIMAAMQKGTSLIDYTRAWLDSAAQGAALMPQWYDTFSRMVAVFKAAPEDARYDWFGPPMGVAMFATARQMETWAHGLSVFDVAGENRVEEDRIKHICVIGCKTFGWTFQNRGETPPGPVPRVQLTLPSGSPFEAGDGPDSVTGQAVDFAKVVTQTRNIADVDLTVKGPVAARWMAIAQCFAGPPEQPPAPGTRV